MPTKTSSTGPPPPPRLEACLACPAPAADEHLPEAREASAGRAAADPSGIARPKPVLAGVALAALVGIVAIVRLADGLKLPMPFCGLRRLTGLPCPACGSMRSLLAWANFQPLEALRLNPLLFCLMIGLAAWASAHLSDRFLGTHLIAALPAGRKKTWTVQLLFGLAALNWVYLWLMLPK